MQNELPKTYDPSEFEDRLYKKWEDSGYFEKGIVEKIKAMA